MTDVSRLIDEYEATKLARMADRTRRSYRWTLDKLDDWLDGRPVETLESTRECERFLAAWAPLEPSTLGQRSAALAGFTAWLRRIEVLTADPMLDYERPRRKRPEVLDVVTVSSEDVLRMFESARTWHEALCLTLVAYTGARRGATAGLRWRDVDLDKKTFRFHTKGGEVLTQPFAEDLEGLLRAAKKSGEVDTRPDAYVIPNLMPSRVTRAERDDRIVWVIVRRIAERAGVRTHVHALRGAFAVFYIEEHGGTVESLKELMGHKRIETTYVYLRRLDRRRQMEQVRTLSWGATALSANPLEAHTGFEPVLPTYAVAKPSDDNTPADAPIIQNPYVRGMLARLREPKGTRA